jgi:hypothetical protein
MLIPNKIPISHLFSSDHVIDIFLMERPYFFFLLILIALLILFLGKKIIKLEKINFITNKNKSKNPVGKSNSQMLLSCN